MPKLASGKVTRPDSSGKPHQWFSSCSDSGDGVQLVFHVFCSFFFIQRVSKAILEPMRAFFDFFSLLCSFFFIHRLSKAIFEPMRAFLNFFIALHIYRPFLEPMHKNVFGFSII